MKTFDDLDHHTKINKNMEILSSHKDIPHLLIYGPQGSGKTTRIMCLMEKMFGQGVYCKQVKTTTIRGIDVKSTSSNYHIEIDLSTIDQRVTYDYLKLMSEGQSIWGPQSMKIIFITNADYLDKQVQSSLRRTMENCTDSCRIILESRNYDKIINPLSSRCFSIRIPSFEKVPIKCNWELYIKSICESISISQNPRTLFIARERIGELLSSNVQPDEILVAMNRHIMVILDDMISSDDDIENAKLQISKSCALCEYRVRIGTNCIIHIEAFMVNVMKTIKNMNIDI